MGRLGSPRAQAPVAQQPAPPAPPPSAPDDESDREPESNGEELFLCLVEAVKDLPMRTKLDLGRAMLNGSRFGGLSDNVKEAYEAAAELVWSEDEDEEDEDEDEDEDEESGG